MLVAMVTAFYSKFVAMVTGSILRDAGGTGSGVHPSHPGLHLPGTTLWGA